MSFGFSQARRLRFFASVSPICLPLIIAAMPAPTFAQAVQAESDDAYEIGEVLVTARKREERLIDVPQSVQAISSEEIAAAGIENLEDLGRQTTNVVLNTRSDNEPNVVVRGVGSFGNTQGIGFYFDDVQNFTDQSTRLEDVERVEILKGPQGTLYGGSSIGGAVKYVLRRPNFHGVSGQLSASLGSFDSKTAFAGVNLPASETLAFRVSGYFADTDGWIKNTFTGSELRARKEYGGRIAALWAPSEDFDAYLQYRYGKLDGSFNAQIPASSTSDFRRSSALNVDPSGSREVHGVTLQLRGTLGAMDLYSISSYAQARRVALSDVDQTVADAVEAFSDVTTKVYTQELRLQSNGDGPLAWVAGAYYSRVTGRGLSSVDVRFGPPLGGPFVIPLVRANLKETTYAAFGDVSYEFGRFAVSVGGRLSRNEVHGVFPLLGTTEDSNDTIFIPKVTVSYDLNDDVMAYATVAKGFEPGRVNPGVGGATTAPFSAEVATNYEVGLKGAVADGRLVFELAGFYMKTKDRQLESRTLVNNQPEEFILNVGDSRSYGFEAGATFRPTRELTVRGGFGYLDAKWTNGEFNLAPVKGLDIPYAANFTANGSVEWKKDISNSHFLSLRADVAHTGRLYWDVFNDGRADPYTLVGARIAVGDNEKGWELSLRVDNIFGEEYFTELGFGSLGAYGPDGSCAPTARCHQGYPGMPRNFTVALNVPF